MFRRMLNFMRKHWAATSALGLAGLTAAGVITTIVFFPPALPAIAAFSMFGVTPFAFLATMGATAATAAAGAIAFGLSLAVSTLFNAAVSIYNAIDRSAQRATRYQPRYSALDEGIELQSTSRHTKGSSFSLMGSLMGCVASLTSCCPSSKKAENPTHHKSPISTDKHDKKKDKEDSKEFNPESTVYQV
ncbi:Uncharacterised protein [Legionella lansingensis]|uniref:Transmembrane protein n=1 Tax=Legionella lansingensis TaxID=45067 RepID=A0A0W0VLI2_9GAMM|nr:hypothetical protein [Legionella lansingensis]KTD20878.1 hypothetical protein Llan_1608 [Legionella lansingensis]SNV43662.1 Uncharacterised protein [Legionella lansingensis]